MLLAVACISSVVTSSCSLDLRWVYEVRRMGRVGRIQPCTGPPCWISFVFGTTLILRGTGALPLYDAPRFVSFGVVYCDVCRVCMHCDALQRHRSKRYNRVLRIRIWNLKTLLGVCSLLWHHVALCTENTSQRGCVGYSLFLRSTANWLLSIFNTTILCCRKRFPWFSLCATVC